MAKPAAPTARVSRNSRRVTNLSLHLHNKGLENSAEDDFASDPTSRLQRSRIFQGLLHSRPTNPSRLFRRGCAVPVGLKAHGVMITEFLEDRKSTRLNSRH